MVLVNSDSCLTRNVIYTTNLLWLQRNINYYTMQIILYLFYTSAVYYIILMWPCEKGSSCIHVNLVFPQHFWIIKSTNYPKIMLTWLQRFFVYCLWIINYIGGVIWNDNFSSENNDSKVYMFCLHEVYCHKCNQIQRDNTTLAIAKSINQS